MSYTPTNWQSGDVVNAEKLNKLEQGVANAGGGGFFVLNAVYDENNVDPPRLDKTVAEIKALLAGGGIPIVRDYNDYGDNKIWDAVITTVIENQVPPSVENPDGVYYFEVNEPYRGYTYVASAETDYPSQDAGPK